MLWTKIFAGGCIRPTTQLVLRYPVPAPPCLLPSSRFFSQSRIPQYPKKNYLPGETVDPEEAQLLWIKFKNGHASDFTLREYQIVLRYIRGGIFNKYHSKREQKISEWATRIETHMRNAGHSILTSIYNDLLQCKAGDISATNDLLSKMPADNVDPNHHRILLPLLKTYSMTGNFQKAEEAYQKLCNMKDGALAHSATKVYLQGLTRGFYINQMAELVESYRSSGKKLDDQMYDILLFAYITEQNIPASFATIKELQSEGHRIRRTDLVRLVRACIETGDVPSAWKGVELLQRLHPKSSVQSINLSIRIYAADKRPQAAWKEYAKIKEGIAVETGTLKALGKVTLECLPLGVVVPTKWIENAGIPLDAPLYKRLLLMYRLNAASRQGGTGRLAEEVLWRLVDLNAADASDYGHVVSAYAHSGERDMMGSLLNVMKGKGIEVDGKIYLSMLMSCYSRSTETIDAEGLRELLALLHKEPLELQTATYALLEETYADDHPMREAVRSAVPTKK